MKTMYLLGCLFPSVQWNVWGMTALIVLLIVYCVLLVKYKKLCIFLRNKVLVPITGVAGFIIYFIGYMDGGTKDSLVALSIRSFISTFHMFFLHSDLIEVRQEMHHEEWYMILFSIVHLMAFLITFMVVIQLFGKHILSWVRLKFASASESYVFFGLNDASFALAKDLMDKRKNPLIVFLDKRVKSRVNVDSKMTILQSVFRNREPLFEQASKTDVLLLNKEYTESTTLRDIGIERLLMRGNTFLFFFSDNTEYNVQSAVKIVREASRLKRIGGKMEIYVKAEADYMIGLFEPLMPKHVNVHIVNSAKLAVMELMLAHPPVDYVDIDTERAVVRQDFTMMVIGFGDVGGYALRYLTELGQFVGSNYRAIVVDKRMDSIQGEFEYRFSGMRHYGIEYHKMQVDSVDYWALLDKNLERLSYVVVSLGDADLNMRAAINISRYAKRKRTAPLPIFVKVHDSSDYDYVKIAEQAFEGIHVFGGDESVFTEKIIVNEGRNWAARQIHDFYNRKKAPKDRIAWEDLTVIKKITNVSAAMHIYTKLRLAGLTVEDVRRMKSEEEYWNALGVVRQENLAQGEHLHWNATLFVNEWDTWSPVPADAESNQDDRRKLHACLVDWNELEWVEKRFGDPYREYDRDSVRKIYELVKNRVYPE